MLIYQNSIDIINDITNENIRRIKTNNYLKKTYLKLKNENKKIENFINKSDKKIPQKLSSKLKENKSKIKSIILKIKNSTNNIDQEPLVTNEKLALDKIKGFFPA